MKKASKLSTFITLLFSLAMTTLSFWWFLVFNGFFVDNKEIPFNISWLGDLLTESKILLGIIVLLGPTISLVLINILIKKFRSN